MKKLCRGATGLALIVWLAVLATAEHAVAQQNEYHHRIGHEGCRPVSQRTGELGCWSMAAAMLGKLAPRAIFSPLDIYRTTASTDAAKGTRGSELPSPAKTLLFTIYHAGEKACGVTHVGETGA